MKRNFYTLLLLLLSCTIYGQTAFFTLDNTVGCTPLVINAEDQSTGATSWFWTVNTSSPITSTDQFPAFLIEEPGSFDITLSINGGVSTHTENIIVSQAPEFTIETNDDYFSCSFNVEFSINLISAGTGNLSYSWLSQDGIQISNSSSYSMNLSPNQQIELYAEVTDTFGCVSLQQINYTAPNIGQADFSVDIDSSGSCGVFFPSFNLQNAYGVEKVKWYFDLSSENPNYIPTMINTINDTIQPPYTGYVFGGPDNGYYDVAVVIEYGNGCIDSIYKDNFIYNGGPTFQLIESADTIEVGDSVIFNITTNADSFSIISFNTNTTLYNTTSFTLNYDDLSFNEDIISISLYLDGCQTSTDIDTVYLVPPSNATADFTTILPNNCAPTDIQFVDQSIGASQWEWTLYTNPIQTSTSRNPNFVIIQGGIYDIELNINNGASSITKTVEIFDRPDVDFYAEETQGEPPFSTTFYVVNNSGDLAGLSFIWDFGDTVQSSTDSSVTVVFEQPGSYDADLIATDSNGCKTLVSKSNYIQVTSSPIEISLDNNCDKLRARFDLLSSMGDTVVVYPEQSSDNQNYQGNSKAIKRISFPSYLFHYSYEETGPDNGYYDVAIVFFGDNEVLDSIYIDSAIFFNKFDIEMKTESDTVSFGEPVQYSFNDILDSVVVYNLSGRYAFYEPEFELPTTGLNPGQFYINDITFYSEECIQDVDDTFYVTPPINSITSQVFLDLNQNGVFDNDEVGLRNQTLAVNSSANIHLTGAAGVSIIYGDEGEDYTLSVNLNDDWTLTTDSSEYHFRFPQDNEKTYYFGLYPTSETIDLSAILIYNARCNSEVDFAIRYTNDGFVVADGIVEFIADDRTEITYTGFVPNDTSEAGNLMWNVNNIYPTTTRNLPLKLQMPSEQFVGDTLEYTVNVYMKDDNGDVIDTFSITYNPIVRCSYDPNDKLVTPIGLGEQALTQKESQLNYTVRFQNTGNDVAYDVRIEDVLDDNLDLSTLIIRARSHPMRTTLNTDTRLLTFSFPNINLPDSTSNPSGSEGYVNYTISPISGLADSTEIENNAAIIFDSNPAIITNTVRNTLVDVVEIKVTTNILNNSYADFNIALYPNPMRDVAVLNIRSAEAHQLQIELVNMLGQRIDSYQIMTNETLKIENRNFSKGTYFIKILDTQNKVLISTVPLTVH